MENSERLSMKHISTGLNQFLQIILHNEFGKLEKQLKTDHYTKYFKTWNLMTVCGAVTT